MTDLVDRLALIIDAKTDNAVSSIRKLSLEEQAAAERTDLLKAKISDLETRMARSATGGTAVQQRQLAKLNSEYKSLTSTLTTAGTRATRAEGALSKLGLGGLVPSSTLGAIGKAVPGLAAGAAVFGGFEFLKSGVEDFVNLADAVRKFQQASGASAEDASKLVGISNALGLSTDSLSLGMFRLAKNIALTPEHLTQYGVAIARTSQGNVDLVKTLENVTTAYQRESDITKKNELVYEAFGRAGTSLLPILNANKDTIEELVHAEEQRGHIFSQEDINNAREYQIATRELKDSFHSLATSAAKTLVPALTTLDELLSKSLDTSHDQSTLGAFLRGPLTIVEEPFKLLAKAVGSGGGGADKAKTEIQSEQDLAQLQALQQQVAAGFGAAFGTLVEPQNVQRAKGDLRDAKRALDDARAERAKAVRDLQEVRQGSPGASASQIEAAVARVKAAEGRLQTARYTGGPGEAQARASLLSAESTLSRLRQQGGVDTNRLADAEERLHRANRQLHDDQKKLNEAQRGVNQARGLTARQILHRATKEATDAAKRVTDETRLRQLGLSAGATAELFQEHPESLHRIAKTATRGLVQGINEELDARGTSLDIAGQLIDPQAFQNAGAANAKDYLQGFGGILTNALPSLAGAQGPRKSPTTIGGILSYGLPGVTVQGDIVVQGKNAKQVANEIASKARHRALTNGSPDPFSTGPGGI